MDSIEGLRETSLFMRMHEAYPDHEVYVKLEGLNTAGSIKLKAAVALIDHLEKDGRLRPGGGVVESSSGSLGVALAAVCARRGYSLTIVTDPNANDATVAHMKALGARVEVVNERDESGGYLGTRLARIQQLQSLKNGPVWTNQYSNSANSNAHSTLTYPAIVEELGDPDLIFVGAGTTGTLMGVIQGVSARRVHTEVYAIDSVGSVTFGGPPSTRHIPGLGASVRPPLFVGARVPHQYYVREEDAVRECRRVAASEGYLPGGSTGTILAGFRALSSRIPTGSRIVVVAPDLGERYLNTVYNDIWVNQKFGHAALDVDVPPMTTSAIYDYEKSNV
ncbi:2,3-diaminopropionate biosynthesis protein SbnA [Microbacterium sp. K2]|uniref:2,3-diaminopropionate biosynthesis protein SbnA n=1 Tax=Microbacterium sp. K2 TaxID=3391827 RepID=UPI003EDA3369